jgi:hypothetical protein
MPIITHTHTKNKRHGKRQKEKQKTEADSTRETEMPRGLPMSCIFEVFFHPQCWIFPITAHIFRCYVSFMRLPAMYLFL